MRARAGRFSLLQFSSEENLGERKQFLDNVRLFQFIHNESSNTSYCEDSTFVWIKTSTTKDLSVTSNADTSTKWTQATINNTGRVRGFRMRFPRLCVRDGYKYCAKFMLVWPDFLRTLLFALSSSSSEFTSIMSCMCKSAVSFPGLLCTLSRTPAMCSRRALFGFWWSGLHRRTEIRRRFDGVSIGQRRRRRRRRDSGSTEAEAISLARHLRKLHCSWRCIFCCALPLSPFYWHRVKIWFIYL